MIDYLGVGGEIMVGKFAVQAVLMHDPMGLLSLGSSPSVEHQRFLHPHQTARL